MKQSNWLFKKVFGIPPADHVHALFFAELAKLTCVPKAEFIHGFLLLLSQMEHDFAMEEKWMEEIHFSGAGAHRDMHAEVLNLLRHAQARAVNGDYMLGRKLVALLPHWFSTHMSTMDMALADALQHDCMQGGHCWPVPPLLGIAPIGTQCETC